MLQKVRVFVSPEAWARSNGCTYDGVQEVGMGRAPVLQFTWRRTGDTFLAEKLEHAPEKFRRVKIRRLGRVKTRLVPCPACSGSVVSAGCLCLSCIQNGFVPSVVDIDPACTTFQGLDRLADAVMMGV